MSQFLEFLRYFRLPKTQTRLCINCVLQIPYYFIPSLPNIPNFSTKYHRRRKRGGPGPPNNFGGGEGQHTLWPPNNPPFPSISMWNGKNHKCTKLKGKIIINVTLIWFEGTGKTISLNSILEFSIIPDFKMRIVIIWHWFIKNLVGTWRRNDVDATSFRRIDVITTSCACCEFGPPPWPPNILNLPTPMNISYWARSTLMRVVRNYYTTACSPVRKIIHSSKLESSWIISSYRRTNRGKTTTQKEITSQPD